MAADREAPSRSRMTHVVDRQGCCRQMADTCISSHLSARAYYAVYLRGQRRTKSSVVSWREFVCVSPSEFPNFIRSTRTRGIPGRLAVFLHFHCRISKRSPNRKSWNNRGAILLRISNPDFSREEMRRIRSLISYTMLCNSGTGCRQHCHVSGTRYLDSDSFHTV